MKALAVAATAASRPNLDTDHPTLRLARITTTASLRDRARVWDDLWERSGVASPAARAEPLAIWLDHFAAGCALQCLTVERSGRLDAALPLYCKRAGGVLPTLRLPRNGWAISGDLLVDPEAPEAVYDALARRLSHCSAGLLWLTLAPYEEPQWQRLRAAMLRAGMPLLIEKQYDVPQVELASDWGTYDRSRDGDARRSRNRYARMMERDGGANLEVVSHFEPRELERLLRLGFKIEDRSWKGEEGSSVLKQPGLFDFTLRQARHYADRDDLRLVFLKLAGEPIAFTYQYRSKGTQFCEKLGYDQRFRRYGPGRQMIMRLLQDLHEDPECRVLDFAGRLMDWNAEWATRSHPVGRIIAAPRGVMGRMLLEGYRRGGRIIRKRAAPSCYAD